MEFIEKENYASGKTYEIKIKITEDMDALEIAECFVHQYPNKIAVVTSAKIDKEGIRFNLIFVGLNYKKMFRKKKC